MNNIERIPKDWKAVRLGDNDIAEIRRNRRILKYENAAFIPMNFVPSSNIYAKYEIRSKKDIKSFTYCEKADLLLAKITPSLENGKQGIVPVDVPHGFALATTEVFPISCKGIHNVFLFYVLKHNKFRNKIIASMTGTTGRQRATKESIENLFIPFAPLPEQKKIAEILSTVDQAIEKVGEAIEKTQRLKKGLMQELLTKGIGHKEYKETDIGRIPKDWEVKKVIDLFEVKTGTTPSTKQKGYWQEGIISWITPSDLSKLTDTTSIEEGERKITETALKEVNLSLLPKESIIISTRAPVGYVAVIFRESTFNQGCKGLVPKSREILSSFYCYYLQGCKSKLDNLSSGSTFKELSKERLENFKIPELTLKEQHRIANILGSLDKRLESFRNKKEKLKKVKRGLMEDLLTGKRRVKLEA
jgi:type I restriction enzyme S subunit